jgi:hypothetical protein
MPRSPAEFMRGQTPLLMGTLVALGDECCAAGTSMRKKPLT